jgi:hypothetical protein
VICVKCKLEVQPGERVTVTPPDLGEGTHVECPGDLHHSTEGTNGILYASKLRELLEGLPDHTQVVLADKDGWFDNVAAVIVPSKSYETQEYAAVTLEPGVGVDSRQF